MLVVIALGLGLWLLGRRMGTPPQARWITIGLLYLGVLAALVVLPHGSPLRVMLGGDLGNWLVIGALAAVALGYWRVLRAVRGRVLPENRQPDHPKNPAGPLTGTELDRYARHIVLREVGGAGQVRLKRASVLVIGAGGLGAPVLQYLAAAGVGTIGVIDDDTVENANLQRQVIHTDAAIGMPKVFSAERAMKALNPHIAVRPYHRRLTAEIAGTLVADYNLVLDGSDTFETRDLVNRACTAAGIPLIAGAIAQWEGQVSLYHPAAGGPCYACVFPQAPAPGLAPSCAEAGVIGPLPGVVGSMMALEAVKHLAGAGEGLAGTLLVFDGLYGESRRLQAARRPGCPVCAAPAPAETQTFAPA